MQILISLLLLVTLPLPALAGQAEAKELARNYNCTVIGITEQAKITGMEEITTYKVDCLLPAAATEDQKKANGSLLIRCNAALCTLLKKGE